MQYHTLITVLDVLSGAPSKVPARTGPLLEAQAEAAKGWCSITCLPTVHETKQGTAWLADSCTLALTATCLQHARQQPRLLLPYYCDLLVYPPSS